MRGARQIRNGFRNLERARDQLREHTPAVLGRVLAEADFTAFDSTLETHNLGIIDRKYPTKVAVRRGRR